MPWTNPKTDWDTNPTNPLPSDFNRIEGNIDYLKTDIETKKGLIVDALNSVGIAALIADTHVQLASKITGAEKTGISITPGTVNQAIPKGIYDTGGGTVLGDPDLISANIKAGVNIFGVAGNSNVVDTSGGDATAAQILSGKKAYVGGALVTGNIPSKVAATITPGATAQTIAAGQYLSGIQTISGDADLIAANIKNGVNIFGVAGTFSTVGVKRVISYPLTPTGTSPAAYTLPSACALKNSFLFVVGTDRYSTSSSGVQAEITNTTTITITKIGSYFPDGFVLFVEFNEGVIKSKQIVSPAKTSSVVNVTISTVDPSKTMAIGTAAVITYSAISSMNGGYVYDATTLRVPSNGGGYSIQIMEFN